MSITKKVLENCKKPVGIIGKQTIKRMNKSHMKLTEWGLSQINVGARDSILDVGCGGGKALKLLSQRAKNGKLYGVDYSKTSVVCAKKENRRDVAVGKMEILHGSVSKLPFKENVFDVITSVESYYFWPELQHDLCEVWRVLKPDGVFLIIAEMYNHVGQSEKDKQIVKMLDMYNNTPEEFRQMLGRAGYRDVEIFEDAENGWICAKGVK